MIVERRWLAMADGNCPGQMEQFRQCWKAQGNDNRTATKDTKDA